MKINKEIVSKIPRDYVFITGTFDIDAPYFKKRIEEVIRRVKRLAKEKGLSERIAESLWRKLIELSIDHEYEILKNQERKEV